MKWRKQRRKKGIEREEIRILKEKGKWKQERWKMRVVIEKRTGRGEEVEGEKRMHKERNEREGDRKG